MSGISTGGNRDSDAIRVDLGISEADGKRVKLSTRKSTSHRKWELDGYKYETKIRQIKSFRDTCN
jgi:hypothetical protein